MNEKNMKPVSQRPFKPVRVRYEIAILLGILLSAAGVRFSRPIVYRRYRPTSYLVVVQFHGVDGPTAVGVADGIGVELTTKQHLGLDA